MNDTHSKMTKWYDTKGPANELTSEMLTFVPLGSWVTKLTVLGMVTDNQTTSASEKINIHHSNGIGFVPTGLTLWTNSQFYN